jgi:hypothetical protein
LGEKISGTSCEAYEFLGKTVPEIFLERWQRSGNLKLKFIVKTILKNFSFYENVISEMKQTKI